jgi:integrase
MLAAKRIGCVWREAKVTIPWSKSGNANRKANARPGASPSKPATSNTSRSTLPVGRTPSMPHNGSLRWRLMSIRLWAMNLSPKSTHTQVRAEPIWNAKPETASRVRQRMERILSWAMVKELRAGANPAQWRGHLDNIFPKRSKVRSVVHHRVFPPQHVPDLMAASSQDDCTASRALRFLTLTACRTNEGVGPKWSEIDLVDKLWTIPKKRMKARLAHRVSLSRPALRLFKEMAKNQAGVFVFWFQKPDRPLSNMAMLALFRRMKRDDVAPTDSESRWGRERGRSILFASV